MGLFEGKKGLIVGVANDRSIAWAIARTIMEEGGECGFTYLPDREDDEKQKNRRRVEKCTRDYPEQTKFLVPMNVADDENIKQAIDKTVEEFGKIDFLLHSVAFADRDDLSRDTIETSREGFKMAMEISAYSLIAIANAAKGIFNENASVRYLSHDLGPQGIRVNAVSAGPLKTLAGSAAGVGPMLQMYEHMAPLARNITHEEVGRTGAFLLSDFSDGITGEILHIDGGYNIMGHPGRLLDKLETE
ncbi:MAG: SDR family oxidoreductase [Pirellulales bacterium]|nr:SDR family oxidoreductase [Pirellulales bacterium]